MWEWNVLCKIREIPITEILTAQQGLSFKGRTELLFICSYRACLLINVYEYTNKYT